jgi:hypothetical protein
MKYESFVPGRLCLFVEHTDWVGKYLTMLGGQSNQDSRLSRAIYTSDDCQAQKLVDVW